MRLMTIMAVMLLTSNLVSAQGDYQKYLDTEALSVKMVISEMIRNPDATYLDGRNGERKWNYTTGLELRSFLDVAERYDLPGVVGYVKDWADTMANDDGVVYKYKKSNYNVDHICPARIYFNLHDMYGDQTKKYRRVLRKIREQLDTHPRTKTGEFWHKQIYPHQVWLDGFYMALPFYAEYTKRYSPKEQRDSLFSDIAHQFIEGAKNTKDHKTGLFRHAWDESKSMFWADPQTGLSEHAWGRACGWYAVALVEVLDYMPRDHHNRKDLIDQLNYLLEVLPKWADPQTGMWYQVLDSPTREGNYLESTCSIMFTYAFLKGLRMGYIDKSHSEYIVGLYDKFLKTFLRTEEDGTISITNCCSVGGLGGKQMRKGDFAYYLSEPVIDNDCKGVGPFIWASLEIEAMRNIEYFPKDEEPRELAFEGAEGGGKYTKGGRGGRVYVVNTLEDGSHEGTLRHAVEAEGPRIVEFSVEGDIHLDGPLNIENPFLTINGQTAPGEGITLRDHNLYISADEVIIRYIRARLGDASGVEADAIGAKHSNNVIIDHCSFSWAIDENASFYANRNMTVQWCIISEALNHSVHSKGQHGYGGIWGGRNVTFHHNLFAHNNSRNPRFDHPRLYNGEDKLLRRGSVQFANNVIYNWGMKAIYGGEDGWFDVSDNWFRPGPATRNIDGEYIEFYRSESTSMNPGTYRIHGNVYDISAVKKGGFQGAKPEMEKIEENVQKYAAHSDVQVRMPVEYIPTDASNAYKEVLKSAGASIKRDCVDKRIVKEVKKGTAGFVGSKTGYPGIVDSVKDFHK